MPKAREVNETVSIDLKPASSMNNDDRDKRQIVYIMDEFSRFTATGISKNKEAEEVVKVLIDKWCHGLLGYPRKGFFADNGTEFRKETLEQLCRRLNISIKTTPSYSPWSNGDNERKHGAINLTARKLMEDDPSMTLEEALQHATWARNTEPGRHRVAPIQIITGQLPVIPGVSDGNCMTDAIIKGSDTVRQHFDRQEKVKVIYRQAEASRRLKDASKARIYPYMDQIYKVGDKITYLDKNDQWSGPAVIQE